VEQRVILVATDCGVLQAKMVLVEILDRKVLLACKEQLALKAHKAWKESRVLLERMVILAFKDWSAQRVKTV
jgi:hypothetical protein